MTASASEVHRTGALAGAVALVAWGAALGEATPSAALICGGLVVAGALFAGSAPSRSRAAASALLLVASVAGVVGILGLRARSGLDVPEPGEYEGPVTLVTDPERRGGAVHAQARVGDRRVLLEAVGPAAGAVEVLLAGDQVLASGLVEPLSRPTPWTRSRHLSGRLRIEQIGGIRGAAPHAAVANGLRRLLARGAAPLAPDHRSLLFGLTVGDDRSQSAPLAADFRGAGLTHLLAVSGQNLVLALVLVEPVLRRLRLWPRLVVATVVILGFGLTTRFEPSVIRASAVAVVALVGTTIGRPVRGVPLLAGAVTVLMAVDPLLVHSLGFRLSVAACGGILVITPRLVGLIPGPRWLARSVAVTTGAQLAVAPVLIPVFGPMPLAAVPANVVAGSVSGAVMVWGLSAGLVAGASPDALAVILHVPTRILLTVLESVARSGSSLPLGSFDLRHASVGAVAVGLWRLGRRIERAGIRRAGAALLAVTVLVVPVPRPVAGSADAGRDAQIWSDGQRAIVLAGPRASPVDVLDCLRKRRVDTVAVLVLRGRHRDPLPLVDALRARVPVRSVLASTASDVEATVPAAGTRLRVGVFVLEVVASDPSLVVRIGRARAAGAGR